MPFKIPVIPEFVEHRMAQPVKAYLESLTKFLDRELRRRPETGTAVNSVLLQSPNNSVYEVTVSNAGVLVITLISS